MRRFCGATTLFCAVSAQAFIDIDGLDFEIGFDDFTTDVSGVNVASGRLLGAPNASVSFAGFQPFTSAEHPLLPTGYGFNVFFGNGTGGTNLAIGTLYPSNVLGGGDSDLEGGPDGVDWVGGNLDRGTSSPTNITNPTPPVLTNLLIVQENGGASAVNSTEGAAGVITNPNDDGNSDFIRFEFETPLQSFGFAWADNESTVVDMIFTDSSTGATATVGFDEFESGGGGVFESAGIVFGDHYANLFPKVTVQDLQDNFSFTGDEFDQVEFVIKDESGGIAFITGTQVPEPSAAAPVMGVCAALFLWRRRSR